MCELYEHQKISIKNSIDQNFKSGIHCHATGAGKTITAANILLEYNKKYNHHNIIWFAERKSILIDIFVKENLKRLSPEIWDKFELIEFAEKKDKNWLDTVNKKYDKPILLIINRAFLTYNEKYKLISNKFNLVIHDECHSSVADETFKFLKYIKKDASILGFSATPIKKDTLNRNRLNEIYNNNIISNYNLKYCIKNNIILPPKFLVMSSDNENFNRGNLNQAIHLFNKIIDYSNFKKIIVYCRSIKVCEIYSNYLYNNKFGNLKDLKICVDTSKKNNDNRFLTYDEFKNLDSNGIIFSAMKHREGSDIKNLDTCIFLDGVRDRSELAFIQSIGRVLRKDTAGIKKFGLIVDFYANDFNNFYNKIYSYLSDIENLSNSNFEDFTFFDDTDNNYYLNDINIKFKTKILKFSKSKEIDKVIKFNTQNVSLDLLKSKFIRKLKNSKEYHDRLEFELDIINSNDFILYILQAVEVLELIKDIPHLIRGSCGSSLVCYLLGITNIDPIKYNIKFVRFLNNKRKNMPDIDIDFPYNRREEVFKLIYKKWGNQVGRVSNHIHYHPNSALREGLRMLGYRQLIRKYDMNDFINKLNNDEKVILQDNVNNLDGKFKNYSLHCGGIVIFEEKINEDVILKTKTKNQLKYDKREVEKHGLLKLDILSNRGLAQLLDIDSVTKLEDYNFDDKIINLLSSGDNLGLTFSESVTMRKALMLIKPKNIVDLSKCLAIIRPAVSQNKYDPEGIIFDDDAIEFIKNVIGCEEEDADKYRKGFAKNDKKVINEFIEKSKNLNISKYDEKLKMLKNLRKYSFCKSHSISYAQLVLALAYQKVYKTKEFWLSTLNHNNSSYKKWVHFNEAKCAGWNLTLGQRPWKVQGNKLVSTTTFHNKEYPDNSLQQLKVWGYWTSKEFIPGMYYKENGNCVEFRGLIATHRSIKREDKIITMINIGYDNRKYIDITTYFYLKVGRGIFIEGTGVKENNSIIANKIKVF